MCFVKYRLRVIGVISMLALLNLVWFLIEYSGNGYRISNIKSQRDWHDHEAIKSALSRKGLGEIGEAVQFDEYRKALYEEYGFDAVLSNVISVNRSVPEVRPWNCMDIKYSLKLPIVSIIIVFYNEHLSVLLRTIHGIVNRTPDELIQEILLIDDCSSRPELHRPLEIYLNEHFPPDRRKVHLLRLTKRSGLIVARMKGAHAASKKSQVFVFLDAHFEVNYNWLPPLLDPIAHNPMTCTVPTIDTINCKTFKYEENQSYRGYFDWSLSYKMRQVQRGEKEKPSANFREYVMSGCAMAIATEFFWKLGGFDDGMTVWGGEQYEISFKIWMCGGEIISVPCSRLAHLFRDPSTKGNTNLYGNYSFVDNNYRRLIDVWLDEEHRQYVMNHRPKIKDADPGNLNERIAIRERLKCKNFSWMMDNIMPDLKEIFPPVEPEDIGAGIIYSKTHSNACITVNRENKLMLAACDDSENFVDWQRYWHYTWRCEIRISNAICLESDIWNRRVNTYSCHLLGENQKWYYDPKTQWITQLKFNICMVANVKDMRIDLFQCDESNPDMKWYMSGVNRTSVNECQLIS